jgi:hypothetical protein
MEFEDHYEKCPEDGGSTFLENAPNDLRDYTLLYLRGGYLRA